MYSGGLQRVAQMTVNEYEAEQERKVAAQERERLRKIEAAREEARERERQSTELVQMEAGAAADEDE